MVKILVRLRNPLFQALSDNGRQRSVDIAAPATDFFTAEVWTAKGLVTYYVLFFIVIASRKIHVAGLTPHPHQGWMTQLARNVTMEDWGFLRRSRLLIHDRDTKFCSAFRTILRSAGVRPLRLPARSPNLNAFAERWVRSVKEECLAKLILFGERPLRKVLDEYTVHYHHERNHQGKDNAILEPRSDDHIGASTGTIERRKRLGGLLNFYVSVRRTPSGAFFEIGEDARPRRHRCEKARSARARSGRVWSRNRRRAS